jgi:hypothetical protein
MTTPHLKALGISGFLWVSSGCSVTRPLPAAMDAPSLVTYLAEHPAADLRVTEHSGRRYWVHAPEVRGDSLVGRRGYDISGSRIALSLGQVVELRTGHFSPSRTGAAVFGALLAAGATLAILVDEAEPIYQADLP